jgi:hypothetical protein
MSQDIDNVDSLIQELVYELDSMLGSYMLWKEKLGLKPYAGRLSQLISQVDYEKIRGTLNHHLSSEVKRIERECGLLI